MSKKIKNVREAWQFLGEVLETFHEYDLPDKAVIEEGLCFLLEDAFLYPDDGIVRKILETKVDQDMISQMKAQLTEISTGVSGDCIGNLGEFGGDLHNRALFCYFMAHHPKNV